MHIETSSNHTVLVSENGRRVWTFGRNDSGQLGHGDTEDRNVPTEIRRRENELPKDVRIIGASCGCNHTVLLSDDGRIWTFGKNYFGQLGLSMGVIENRYVPTEIPRGENGLPEDVKIVKVSCGEYRTVLLSEDGRIWTFGENSSGQLGHGDIVNRNVPTEIQRGEYGLPEDVKIVDVSCGFHHTGLLSDDGRIWTFGNNYYGQLGLGDIENRYVPTEIQRNINGLPEDVKIVDVSCGSKYTVLLSDDGIIWTFGDNYFDIFGYKYVRNINVLTDIKRGLQGFPENIKIIGVNCGSFHTVLLSDDGRIWTYGFNFYGVLGLGLEDNHKRNVPTEIRDLSLRQFGSLTKSANKS